MTAGLAIFDTMQYVKSDVVTICVGLAASMGAFLLAAGTGGRNPGPLISALTGKLLWHEAVVFAVLKAIAVSVTMGSLKVLTDAPAPETAAPASAPPGPVVRERTVHIPEPEAEADADDAAYLSVRGNTGGGYFSNEWIPLTDVLAALEESPEEINSLALFPLFRGKSANTPGFLLAVLKQEKLAVPLKGRQRKYRLGDTAAFLAKVESLKTGKTKVAKKKAVRKRKAAG